MEAELIALREMKALQQSKLIDFDRQNKWLQTRVDASRRSVEEVLVRLLFVSARVTQLTYLGCKAKAPIQEVLAELNRRRSELVQLEENLSKKVKEAERHAAQAKAAAAHHSTSSSAREAYLQGEYDKCMVGKTVTPTKRRLANVFLVAESSQVFNVQDEHAKYCHNEVHALYAFVLFFSLPINQLGALTRLTRLQTAFCKNCVNERISSRQRKCPACNLPFSQGEVQQLYFQ